jgi:serine/threonine protein kinase
MFARAVAIQSQINLPGVAKLIGFGSVTEDGVLRAVTIGEGAPFGDFQSAITARLKGVLPPGLDATTFSKVIFGVAAMMAQVHALHIIHLDLRPENVLLNARGEPLITGFERSGFGSYYRSVTEDDPIALGSPVFGAPELMEANGSPSQKADVFSFGVFLYVIFTERLELTTGPCDPGNS